MLIGYGLDNDYVIVGEVVVEAAAVNKIIGFVVLVDRNRIERALLVPESW